jgi:hypothetical protein
MPALFFAAIAKKSIAFNADECISAEGDICTPQILTLIGLILNFKNYRIYAIHTLILH